MISRKLILIIVCLFQTIISYAQSPALQWAKSFGGLATDEEGIGMALDSLGNVYTIGNFSGTSDFDPGIGVFTLTTVGSDYDIYITKFDLNGSFVWAKSFKGSGYYDTGYSITVDDLGNVYSTGRYQGTTDFDPGAGQYNLTSGFSTTFISKLDAAGNFVWAKKVAATIGQSITLDSLNNVYLVGNYGGTCDFDPGIGVYNMTSNCGDMFLLKLNSSGNFMWAKTLACYSSSVAALSQGRSVLIGGLSNIYITGSFVGSVDFDPGIGTYSLTSAGNYDAFILKLDSLGNFVWVKQIGGTLTENPISLAVDSQGSVFSAGSFMGTADFDPGPLISNLNSVGDYDGYILKLNSVGDFVWVKQIGGTTFDQVGPITIDSWGDIYFSGNYGLITDLDPGMGTYTATSNGTIDLFLEKLDSSGNFLWVKTISGNQKERPSFDIKVDAFGNIYSNGGFESVVDFDPDAPVVNLTSAGGFDLFVYKMSQCITPPAPVNTTSLISQTLCANQIATLTAIASATINWFSSSTSTIVLGTGSTFLTPTLSAGTYSYYAESIVCLPSVTRTPIVITVYSLPNVIASSNASLICTGQTATLTASGANTYTWSSSATGSNISISPTVTTNYTVTSTDANGCKNDAIITQSVSLCTNLISSPHKIESGILIYPNPNTGNFTIKLNSPSQIKIYNSLGQIIYDRNQNELRSEISISNYSNGIYLIQILDKEKIIYSGRIIKN
jgi:hypothetical protein